MTDKQINRQLRREFSGVGWALLVYFGIMNVLAIVTLVVDMLGQMLRQAASGQFTAEPDMNALTNNAWGYIAAIIVGIVILHGWKGPDYWRQEILVKERRMKPTVFLICLCLCMGGQMLNSLWIMVLEAILNGFDMSLMPMMESVSGSADSISMFLYASLLGPISEEIIFRGYVLRSLRPYGKRFAIVGSALLFGLFHGNLLQVLNAFLMGLIMGYLTVEYSIFWATALHIFNNLVLADLLTRLTAGLPEVLADAINLLLLGGCAVVSIVILVVRRREVAAYNRGEWMDRRVLKCFFTNSGILVLSVLMGIMMVSLLFM